MDRLRSLKWPVIGISLALALAVLFAARWLVMVRLVETPLSRMLKTSPAVAGFAVSERSGERLLRVELREVADLGEVFRSLSRQVTAIPAGPRSVEVADRRTPTLNDALNRMSPLVHEAIATGRYSLLVPGLEETGRQLGLDRVRVGIDSWNVYLQLHEGPAYLYEVFPRLDAAQSGRAGGDGR